MTRKSILAAALLSAVILSSCESTPLPQQTTEETAQTTAAETGENASQTALRQSGRTEYYQIKPWTAVGTGMKKPENAGSDTHYYFAHLPIDQQTLRLSGIADKAVLDKVNSWISEAALRAETECKKEREKVGSTYSNDLNGGSDVGVSASCYNGYLIIDVRSTYFNEASDNGGIIYLTGESAIFDLYTGEKIELPELFYEGVDFISFFNSKIRKEISLPQMADNFETEGVRLKREFAGITEDMLNNITPALVFFPKNNPYFPNGFQVGVNVSDSFFRENSLLGVSRDMEGLLNLNEYSEIYHWQWEYETDGTEFMPPEAKENTILSGLIKSCPYLSDEQIERINGTVSGLVGNSEAEERLGKIFEMSFDTPMYSSDDGWFNGIFQQTMLYPKQNFFTVCFGGYMYEETVIFAYDLDTFERLTNEEILERSCGSDWRSEMQWQEEQYSSEYAISRDTILNNIDAVEICNIQIPEDDSYPPYIWLIEPVEGGENKRGSITLKEKE